MHMTFWFGYDLEGFFFPSLNISTIPGLAACCVILFVVACFYECIKLWLTGVKLKLSSMRKKPCQRCMDSSQQPLIIPPNSTRWVWFTVETCLYALEVIVGYMLMLGVMYYNASVFIVVVAGLTVGYALVGTTTASLKLKASRLKSDNCANCSRSTSQTATTREGSEEGSDSSHCDNNDSPGSPPPSENHAPPALLL